MTYFDNKTLLITGGTGSFGEQVLSYLSKTKIHEIRILSRDEKKQDDLRKKYNQENIKFYIGDTRDYNSIFPAFDNVDYVFHAAALKQVPSCEFFPLEAVKTNVLGTENVLNASISSGVKKVVCLSTDKAVYPINAMGISKAMMEKIAIAKSRETNKTIITITRYGNVMASRGSVIPLIINQIKDNKPLTITNPSMTRFMMTLNDAVDLVIYAFRKGKSGEIIIQKSPGATINVVVQALIKLMKSKTNKIKIIGTRHGEKKFEVLCGKEEMLNSKDVGKYIIVHPDNRDLNYDVYTKKGIKDIDKYHEYNSENTTRLSLNEMISLLKKIWPIEIK